MNEKRWFELTFKFTFLDLVDICAVLKMSYVCVCVYQAWI